jgi:hypothetical protein
MQPLVWHRLLLSLPPALINEADCIRQTWIVSESPCPGNSRAAHCWHRSGRTKERRMAAIHEPDLELALPQSEPSGHFADGSPGAGSGQLRRFWSIAVGVRSKSACLHCRKRSKLYPILRPSASMLSSPSSFINGPGGRRSSRSRTASLGRQSFTPRGVQTIGRLTSTGCSSIAAMIASSAVPGSSRPSSAAGDLVSRKASRGVRLAAAKSARSCGSEGS